MEGRPIKRMKMAYNTSLLEKEVFDPITRSKKRSYNEFFHGQKPTENTPRVTSLSMKRYPSDNEKGECSYIS